MFKKIVFISAMLSISIDSDVKTADGLFAGTTFTNKGQHLISDLVTDQFKIGLIYHFYAI